MASSRNPIVGTAAILLIVAAAAIVVVVVAPEESTLGRGVRSVYVHVALTLTGMLGLVLAAGLGVVGLVSVRSGVHAWMRAVGRVGLLFYAAGVGASVVAAWVNWGGMFLGEPILRASLLILGVAVLAHLLMPFFGDVRLHAALSLVPALALGMLVTRTALLLHPRGEILRTSPVSMLLTFGALTVLFVLAAARLTWHLRHRSRLESAT